MVTHVAIFAGFFFGGFVAIAAVFLLLAARDARNHKTRARKYEQTRNQLATTVRLTPAKLQTINAVVGRQKEDQPAVTVPLTGCERQERRRVIKLYT